MQRSSCVHVWEEAWLHGSRWWLVGLGGGCLVLYLVRRLKQWTQKRCPHWAWNGLRKISLHFWHWYLISMATASTRRGIPGSAGSKEELKDGRAISFHLLFILIWKTKGHMITHHFLMWCRFTHDVDLHPGPLSSCWGAVFSRHGNGSDAEFYYGIKILMRQWAERGGNSHGDVLPSKTMNNPFQSNKSSRYKIQT